MGETEDKIWDIEFKAPKHQTVVISAVLKSKADYDDFIRKLKTLENNWRKIK